MLLCIVAIVKIDLAQALSNMYLLFMDVEKEYFGKLREQW